MMSPIELTETTGFGDVDDAATRILQEERLSETMRDAFRSMNNSPMDEIVQKCQSDDNGDKTDDDDSKAETRDDGHKGYLTPKKQLLMDMKDGTQSPKTPQKIFRRRSSSSDNISIATALTFEYSDDEASSTSAITNVKGGVGREEAGSKSTTSHIVDDTKQQKALVQTTPKSSAKLIKRLGDELIHLKNDLAYAREREDDYRWAIQTLVTERDLLKLELMQFKNERDNDRCETKRLHEDVNDLRREIAELTMKNTMLEQQRDEYREDRQQLQQTLNRVFQSGGRVPCRDGAPCASELISSIRRASGRSFKGAGQFWRRRS